MIYVNARFLTQDLTGVQRFAQEVCLALSKIRHDIVLSRHLTLFTTISRRN